MGVIGNTERTRFSDHPSKATLEPPYTYLTTTSFQNRQSGGYFRLVEPL